MSRWNRVIGLAVIDGLFYWLLIFLFAQTANAANPRVGFDVTQVIPCKEITTPEFLELYPGERLLEVTIPVSVRTHSGNANAIFEVSIEIRSPHEKMRVAEFVPQTELATDIVGDIRQVKTSEKGRSISGSLGGVIPNPVSNVIAQVTPSIKGSSSKHTTTKETVNRLPALHAVVVSGTTSRGHGVFFILRKNTQNSVEGLHPLAVRFQVPANWQAGQVDVICKATGEEKNWLYTKEKTWANAKMSVALYLSGNLEAKQAAEAHVTKMLAKSRAR